VLSWSAISSNQLSSTRYTYTRDVAEESGTVGGGLVGGRYQRGHFGLSPPVTIRGGPVGRHQVGMQVHARPGDAGDAVEPEAPRRREVHPHHAGQVVDIVEAFGVKPQEELDRRVELRVRWRSFAVRDP
jgi:hypothetical protein